MLEESKFLFNNRFFEEALKISAIHNKEFIIKYFTNDSRIESDADQYCFVGIKGPNFDGNDFFQVAYDLGVRVFLLQKSPSNIPSDAIIYLVDDTIQAIAKLAHYHRTNLHIPHILITGSVGKTTTRLFLHSILQEKYLSHTARKNWNNSIGVPMSILETIEGAKISVLEAGMSSFGEIQHLSNMVRPDIAIITNVGYSHAEYLGSKDKVAEAKIEIVEGMNASSILVINKHDPYRVLFESRAKGQIIYFDPEELFIVEDLGFKGFIFQSKKYPDVNFSCPISGEHLLLNLSIIFALVDVLQIPLEYIQSGLLKVQGLDNRMNIFTNKREVVVIGDCYNASLESFKAALDVLKKAEGRKIAVVGGILELGSFSLSIHEEIGEYINTINPDLVLALGEEANIICQKLRVPYAHFYDKEMLWRTLDKEMKKGDTILLKASNGIGLSTIVSCLASV